MSPEIPEYYRHLATPPEDSDQKKASDQEVGSAEKPRGMPIPTGSKKKQETVRIAPENIYRANTFSINLPDDWTDKTVFTLTGPVTEGIQHNITVTSQADLPVDNLLDFAEMQIQSLADTLKGCRLLLKEPILMEDSREAYRSIFVWWPTEEVRIYQEQVYVLHEQTGFTITASFSKKTRKTLGPEIERAMRSFSPTD